MFYHGFDELVADKYKKVDLLPKDLEKDIDEANEWTYNDINNGSCIPFQICSSLMPIHRSLQVWVRNVSGEKESHDDARY